ncbi:ABC transporter ATP-binding protein [Corynebacterium striatum]|uniref:ATP-binding cassette domain-containing protein n=1 Tax=Corynebacterium striatum TaxID=43770 RepID=UPI000DFB0729|nr:ATP-binding cassette domain-containing protein [Corynebacterium striatum]STD34233.1 ABC transporter ATP-binding protein [Corynebacterium striatum]
MLNIDATHGHTAALGHLAREFAPSRMYGLKGANGSGKSTLLASLGGELATLEGTVEL